MIKEIEYTKKFGDRLIKKQRKTNFPRAVMFEITYRCNLYCRYCYAAPNKDKKELTTEEVKSVFQQLVEAGCLRVILTGGEPLIREDIFSLIEYAKAIGLSTHLLTNATFITHSVAERLAALRLGSLEISFHSLKKERFDWFTQYEGSFEMVMNALRFLRKKKLSLSLKINITKMNIDEVEDLKRFAKDIGISPEWGMLLLPRLDFSRDNLSLRLEPEEVHKVEEELFSNNLCKQEVSRDKPSWENKRQDFIKTRLFQCSAGRTGLVINPYGELAPCIELSSYGYSVLEYGLKSSWEKLKDHIESIKPSPRYKCFDCALKDFCLSCPAKANLECMDMNSCPDYYRRLAELTFEAK